MLPPLPLTAASTVTFAADRATLDDDPRVLVLLAGDEVTDVQVPTELRHRGLGRAFLHRVIKARPDLTLGAKVAAFASSSSPAAPARCATPPKARAA